MASASKVSVASVTSRSNTMSKRSARPCAVERSTCSAASGSAESRPNSIAPTLRDCDVVDHPADEPRDAFPLSKRPPELCETLVYLGHVTGDRPGRARDLERAHAQRGVDVLMLAERAPVTELDASRAHLDRPAIIMIVPLYEHVVAAEARGRLASFEEVDHREVGDDPTGVDARRRDVTAPDVAPGALGRIVAHRAIEELEDLVEIRALSELVEEVRCPRRVAHHLHGLESRDVVEEPPARRVHEHRVPLRLEQRERLDDRVAATHPAPIRRRSPSIEVAPSTTSTYASRAAHGSCEDCRPAALEDLDTVIAEPVERGSQRSAPPLLPARPTAGVAAAVLPPPADAVHARPRALLHLHLPLRRLTQGEVGEPTGREPAPRSLDRERVRDRALPPAVVVTERLAVGRDAARHRVHPSRRGCARLARRALRSTASRARTRRRARAARRRRRS